MNVGAELVEFEHWMLCLAIFSMWYGFGIKLE